MIKFNKHNVRDTETGKSARVFYSLDNHISGRPCVTLYGKDCLEKVAAVLPDVTRNDSDSMSDYIVFDVARLFPEHPLYAAARARAEANRISGLGGKCF